MNRKACLRIVPSSFSPSKGKDELRSADIYFFLVILQTGLFVIQFSGKKEFVLSNLKVP